MMNIQPKTEPGSPPGFTSTNPNNNFEQKTIPDLVNVLRGTCQFDTFDTIEGVLVDRDTRLRAEIQGLEKKFEFEKLQLQEKLQMEVLLRIQAEEEVRKRGELCEKGKRVQESYETLLKEVKITGLADRNMIKELKKKNNDLECEVKNMKEKCVDDGNNFDVIRRKNAELESKVLELRKMKEKPVEDDNELGVLRKVVGELRDKVGVLEDDKNALAVGLKIQIGELEEKVKNHFTTISELEEENSTLADEKRKVEILYKLLCTKFRDLQARVSRLEDDTKLWMNEEDDTLEAAPLPKNEDAQLQNVGGNDAQGTSSGEKCLKVYTRKPRNTVKMAGSSRGSGGTRKKNSASGRMELVNGIEVINLVDEDDNDDDVDRSISRGVQGKTAIFEIPMKDEYPSSSVATQQNSKFTNAVVDTVKRKFPFSDIETSGDDSSNDSSFYDSLPISSVVSQGKKTKM